MSYAKSEATRAKLVKTTSKLLRTQGYAATGISQILTESGVPKGSLYHHFPAGKTELAAAAVQYSNEFIRGRFRALIQASADPADTVAKFCDYYIESLHLTGYQKGCPIATITLEAAATVDALQVQCDAGFTMVTDLIEAQLMQHGVAAEAAQVLSTMTLASIEGALVLCRAKRSTQPLEIVRDSIAAQLRHAVVQTQG